MIIKNFPLSLGLSLCLVAAWPAGAQDSQAAKRIEAVRKTPGFVALWDFGKKSDGRFDAYQPAGSASDYRLNVTNYVREYWGEGRQASYDDFPVVGTGPFGQAVRIQKEADPTFRPILFVPREKLHDTRLDVKGPGRSVSMVVWMIRESGNHALAGIWHEGTDLKDRGGAARRVEPGMRQYALFAGLAANTGGVGAHVSENGAASFGDRYARNLSVTKARLMERSEPAGPWQAAAFVFDNAKNTVTSYLDGRAEDYWIEEGLAQHPFFGWAHKAWTAGERKDGSFPAGQFYRPPEANPKKTRKLAGGAVLHEYEFTKVRVAADGRRELVGLKVNPFYFGHDLYSPGGPQRGGPFTIGRVIHSSKSVGTTGWIGGVAVFDQALSGKEMRRLAKLGRRGIAR